MTKSRQAAKSALITEFFSSALVAVGVGVVVYLVLCYMFGVEEVRDMINKVQIRLRNR